MKNLEANMIKTDIAKSTNITINAHINNISFPKTIEELEFFIYEHGCYNVEDILMDSVQDYTEWNVPRYSSIDDIVLFYHSKTAIQWIRKLETKLKTIDESEHDISLLKEWLNKARHLYSLYGGKIFAIGRVAGVPFKENNSFTNKLFHWGNKIYASINGLYLLKNPIDISEFNNFIFVSRQSGITSLPSTEFNKLKDIIASKNFDLPQYFLESKVGVFNLSKINKYNFLELTKNYRTRFLLESDFRSYYVDNLLKNVIGNNFYRECRCYSTKNPLARVDNVICIKNKNILLEVKLNINYETNLVQQLNQYILADYIYLKNNSNQKTCNFERDYMYIIDSYAIYKYIEKTQQINIIKKLDDLISISDLENIFQ